MHGALGIAGIVVAAVLASGPLAASEPADAEPPVLPEPTSFDLVWEAAPGCPDAAWVRKNVERHLNAADPNERQRVAVDGRVTPAADDGWALDLAIANAHGSGRRRLDAATCEELAEAAALIVAISIDPRITAPEPVAESEDVEPGEPEREPPPAAAAPTPAAPTPAARTPADSPFDPALREQDAAPPRGSFRLGLRAMGGMDVNVLSRIGGTVGLGFGVLWPRWRVDLTGIYWTPTAATSLTRDDVGGLFQLWALGLRGARVLHARSFELPLALGMELGAMHGRGRGDGLRSVQAAALWGAAVAGAGAVWVATRSLALWLQVDGLLAISRPQFETDQGTTVYRTSAGGARMVGGVEARWR